MADVSVVSLDPHQQKQIENARVALTRGQVSYTLEATALVLKSAPGCLAVRRLQRVAQLREFRAKNQFLAKALGGWSAVGLQLAGKKSPVEKLALAEAQLAKNPTSVAGLTVLAEAAGGLGWPETVAFALEAIRELEPKDGANLLALGEAWIAAGRPSEAVKVAEEFLRTRTGDADGQALHRKASVALTVKSGNWEATGSYREKLRTDGSGAAT